MKRITLKQLQTRAIVRPQKKNKSCRLQTQPISKRMNQFYLHNISSAQIATLLIEEFISSLEPALKVIDQQQYIQKMMREISFLDNSMQKMMNPIEDIGPFNEAIWNKNEELNGLQSEFQIKLPQNQKRMNKIAFNVKSNCQSKTLIGDNYLRLQTLPTIRYSKMNRNNKSSNNIQNRKSMEILDRPYQQIDQLQDLLRDKKTARESTIQKKAYYRNNTLQNPFQQISKINNLPSMEEYSYDYDGSLFPLKKYTKHHGNGPKILNTICKINKKDQIDPKKTFRVSKINNQIKISSALNQSLSKNCMQLHEDIVKVHRSIPADSIFEENYDLVNQNSIYLASTIEKCILNKSIKIKEIAV